MVWLEKYKSDVYSCLRCGSCRDMVVEAEDTYGICPVLEHTPGFDVYYSRGKMMLARKVLEGTIEPNKQLAEYIWLCTTCGNCREHCRISQVPRLDYTIGQMVNTPRIDQVAVIEAFRTDLTELGVGLLPKHEAFTKSIKENHNPYLESHEKRLAWMSKEIELPETAEYLYFTGCTSSYRQQEIAQTTANLLLKLKLDFTIIPDEWCCGSPALRTGRRKLVEELIDHNIKAIENTGAKAVITSCAGCYRTLKKDYLEIVGELGFEVLHTVELLEKMIKEGKLKLGKVIPMKATYHDPCHLGRHCGIYDSPRTVLKNIPGVELLEMLRTRSGAWCCGAGGGFKSGFGDLAVEIATDRIKEALETGANALVSACPFCKNNLVDGNEKIGSPLKVYDVVELVAEAAEI